MRPASAGREGGVYEGAHLQPHLGPTFPTLGASAPEPARVLAHGLASYFPSFHPLPFSGLDLSFLLSAKLVTTYLSFSCS